MDKATPAVLAMPPACLGTESFDPLEDTVHGQVRAFERLLEEELAVRSAGSYERGAGAKGHRNAHRERRLVTTFGPIVLAVPRARLADDDESRHGSNCFGERAEEPPADNAG